MTLVTIRVSFSYAPSIFRFEKISFNLIVSFTKALPNGFVADYIAHPIKFFNTSVSCTAIGCNIVIHLVGAS